MTINAILACDANYGIGKDNGLPWPHNEDDMKWFKENTSGHVVVMGRKTWESLDNKKLPNRINCVITHKPDTIQGEPDHIFSGDIAYILRSLEEKYSDLKVWVIGGADLYKQSIHVCDNIYLTKFKKVSGSTKYFCNLFFLLKT